MRVRIHRGARQIGGSCIEVAARGGRIVLDAGMPMGAVPPGRSLLPDVPGLWARGDGSLLGVVISHAHPDHFGLADLVHPSVPIWMGARAAALCDESQFFVPSAPVLGPTRPLVDGRSRRIGPFTVTPLAVDHGIDDAFALLVEAEGRRLLYTGDLRGHGRDMACIDRLAERAASVDVMLLEGTRVGRGSVDDPEATESDVEDLFNERIAAAQSAVIVLSSGQNLDRVEAVIRAAGRAGRTTVLDLYVASLWSATGRDWPTATRVRLSRSERRRVITSGEFQRTRAIRDVRIYDDELRRSPSQFVILPRTSALEELEDLGLLLDADVVCSMWAGYLTGASMQSGMRILRRNGAAVHLVHVSGHACPRDLRRLVHSATPRRVVPVHTEHPEAMSRLVDEVEQHEDDEWWEV